jgi:hypothetical protein
MPKEGSSDVPKNEQKVGKHNGSGQQCKSVVFCHLELQERKQGRKRMKQRTQELGTLRWRHPHLRGATQSQAPQPVNDLGRRVNQFQWLTSFFFSFLFFLFFFFLMQAGIFRGTFVVSTMLALLWLYSPPTPCMSDWDFVNKQIWVWLTRFDECRMKGSLFLLCNVFLQILLWKLYLKKVKLNIETEKLPITEPSTTEYRCLCTAPTMVDIGSFLQVPGVMDLP